MENRIYKTRVNGEVKPFVLCRISAAQELICRDHPKMSGRYGIATIIETDENGNHLKDVCSIFAVKTDQERYDEFSLLVADWYPDIDFEFDTTGPKN